MTLNGYLFTAVVVLLLLSPLILLTCPMWLVWLWFQRRGRKRLGYDRLLPFMARTVEAYARVMIRGDAPGGEWATVTRNLDRFIAHTRSPRVWRLQLLVIIMEVAPLLRLRLPFSLQSPQARADFVEMYLVNARGLLRIASMGRQLIRLSYYAAAETQERMGFVPVHQRAAWRKANQPEQLAETAA
jgi:hypothetical protein